MLVALAIAVPVLTLLYGQGIRSIAIGHTAAAYQEAISRAQSRLALLTGIALVTAGRLQGDLQGDEGGGFHYHTRVTPIGSVPAPRQSGPGPQAVRGTTLYAVSVELSWKHSEGDRAITLASRRLGPSADDPP